MSAEKALEFINELSRNESLQAEVVKVGGAGASAVAELATRHGYECTAEEASSVRAALEASLSSEGLISTELSDEELESVAGGVGSIRGTQVDASSLFQEIADRMKEKTQGGAAVSNASISRYAASPNTKPSFGSSGALNAAPSWLTW